MRSQEKQSATGLWVPASLTSQDGKAGVSLRTEGKQVSGGAAPGHNLGSCQAGPSFLRGQQGHSMTQPPAPPASPRSSEPCINSQMPVAIRESHQLNGKHGKRQEGLSLGRPSVFKTPRIYANSTTLRKGSRKKKIQQLVISKMRLCPKIRNEFNKCVL